MSIMSSPLSALLAIISTGVQSIESTYAGRRLSYPSLDEPFISNPVQDAKITGAVNLVVAAAGQLIATLRSPQASLLDAAGAMHQTACLGVANELHVTEILREAGSEGLHVEEISKFAGTDPSKLGRVLRLLATRHIFREVSPDVFANNRISSLLDTGKSLELLQAYPELKNENTSGISALVSHYTEDSFKAATALTTVMCNPDLASSQEPHHAPFNFAYQTPLEYFDWLEKPGNGRRRRTFGLAMLGVSNSLPREALVKGFDWEALPDGSFVVDVGGGVGAVTLHLAKTYPHLRYIVQDRAGTLSDATKFWRIHFPEAIENKQVQLQEHDFFEPQPIKSASVFLLRGILHDWSDKYAREILVHLRKASSPSTKLIVIENLVSYAAPERKVCVGIPGAELPSAPYPLLANYGLASAINYQIDIQMFTTLNSQARTVKQFVDLVKETGWKLDHVTRPAGPPTPHLIFVPV